jgi:simple sugar transport system permease protein
MRLTRRRGIALVLVVLGSIMCLGYAPYLGGEGEISRLTFGIGRDAPALELPTAATMLLFGGLWLASGVLALSGKLERLSTGLLWICGVLIFPAVLVAAAAGAQTNVLTMVSETLRLATPLALGALAGIYSERVGVVNIAIEGMMLTGAAFGFAAFVFIEVTFAERILASFELAADACNVPSGQARPLPCFLPITLSVLIAMLVGGLIALLHGMLSISFKTDQIISGTVINLLAIGVTSYLRRAYLVETPGGRVTLPSVEIPVLSDIPLVGEVLFEHQPIFYSMLVLVVLTHVVLFSTRWGLRLRAVGENPRAADTVGINVYATRYIGVFISGVVAGLAGAWFSLELVGQFDDGMTNGKGFIALAAMIFGNWTPAGAFGGALLFSFTEALKIRFQFLQVELFGWLIPAQFLDILPYVTTMVVLAGLIGRATPPAAIGQPYEK